ncbi:MAG: hypothetical protein M1812_001022 [Candelaria pacifica]|nr:MAG: hypothetical protein M1812_001022 [Candelaria pacifica]
MEFEVSYTLDNEQQFWDELDDILSAQCQTHARIDSALRTYIRFSTTYREEYLQSEYDILRCSYKLLESSLFAAHQDYIRRQIVASLLQEDGADTLHIVGSFLLSDGRHNEWTFELMKAEGAFPRLVQLVQSQRDDDVGLHRLLLELLYEMSRIQQLSLEELRVIDDAFVMYLFQIVEELSNDVNDPYHYPVIRVLLVLNEQYMVCAHDPGPDNIPTKGLTNKVIKLLSTHGSGYKTFGENIILLLNRESETSLQLLILKLLYLLFTTRSTYEYFYTNDLRVLVDVIIRNLLDLPEESTALRHTYLRVLYPLLAHTQLQHPPHYKRDEISKLLTMMTTVRGAHFAPADETTVRLVGRCVKVPWLKDDPASDLARRMLGTQLAEAGESTLSVLEVAAPKEKPGILTPSRGGMETGFSSHKTTRTMPDTSLSGRKETGGIEVNVNVNVRINAEEQSPFEIEGEA